MIDTDQLHNVFLGLFDDLVTKPQAAGRQLRENVERCLKSRLLAVTSRPSTFSQPFSASTLQTELTRLRTLLNLLPHLDDTALRYLLGKVEIDGRLGDYIEPPPLHPSSTATTDRQPD